MLSSGGTGYTFSSNVSTISFLRCLFTFFFFFSFLLVSNVFLTFFPDHVMGFFMLFRSCVYFGRSDSPGVLVGGIALLIPYEPRGKASM